MMGMSTNSGAWRTGPGFIALSSLNKANIVINTGPYEARLETETKSLGLNREPEPSQ